MELKITQKTFNAAPISALLREGEKAADTLVFVAPKQYGGLILGALQWVVVGNYADYDDFAQQPLQVAETDGNVTLTWVPDNTFTAHPGDMRLWLEGQDNGTTVIKITASQRIAIAPAARKANAAFYAGADAVLQQITAAAVTAQTNANTAVRASETANDRATDAEAAKQAAAQSAAAADKRATDAANRAADADRTANSIKDSMAQISENKEAVSQLKDDLAAEQTAREQSDTSLRQEVSGKLPKSPANWEPWTAEEQAAARERIGIDEPYELIDSFTIDEESVWYVDREVEPDGTAYNFKKVMVYITSYNTNMSGLCRIVSCHINDNKFDNNYSAMFFNSGYNQTYVFCEQRNRFWLTEAVVSHTNGITRSVYSEVDTRNTAYNLITGIRIQFNNYFIVGTKIEIYGVRA